MTRLTRKFSQPNFSPPKHNKFSLLFLILLTLTSFVFFSGCVSRNHTKHLASDAILIVPYKSTQKEVMSILGQPDQRNKISTEDEEWIYFQLRQSRLRKTPLIGKMFGNENYGLLIINFKTDLVTSSTYRILTEDEFKAASIIPDNQLHEK